MFRVAFAAALMAAMPAMAWADFPDHHGPGFPPPHHGPAPAPAPLLAAGLPAFAALAAAAGFGRRWRKHATDAT
jgi:hypothetical protein